MKLFHIMNSSTLISQTSQVDSVHLGPLPTQLLKKQGKKKQVQYVLPTSSVDHVQTPALPQWPPAPCKIFIVSFFMQITFLM